MKNIYAPEYTRVFYKYPENGTTLDQEIASSFLKKDKIYTIHKTVVTNWRTGVCLKEVPGIIFNSVMLEEVESK